MSVKRATIAAGIYGALQLGGGILVLASSGMPDGQIVGTWSNQRRVQIIGGATSIAQFNEDGSYTMSQGTQADFIEGREQRLAGTYNVSGNKLTLTQADGDNVDPEMQFIGEDMLIIYFESGKITLERKQ